MDTREWQHSFPLTEYQPQHIFYLLPLINNRLCTLCLIVSNNNNEYQSNSVAFASQTKPNGTSYSVPFSLVPYFSTEPECTIFQPHVCSNFYNFQIVPNMK